MAFTFWGSLAVSFGSSKIMINGGREGGGEEEVDDDDDDDDDVGPS
jgi:hypothetical protein